MFYETSLPVVGHDLNVGFSWFYWPKVKDCVGSYCSAGNVGSHIFWKDQVERNESKRLVCAGAINPKFKLDHKHGCRNCLLNTENREFVVL